MALSVFDVAVRCGSQVKLVTVIDPAGGTVEDCRRYAVHKFGVERVVSVMGRHAATTGGEGGRKQERS